MSTPTDRNRLEEEASPYLRQHADNPVNWQPWDEDALDAARERDVPIFLSVGYAACHWCHVMEEESFVDDAVAERLNGAFVPIKVDREERPDLDRIYQTACQLLSGRGGWPLSVWLTPEGEPFHVGTYFPRESRGGMPGFLDLLDDIADSWDDPGDRADLEARADRIASHVRSELEETPAAASDDGAAAMLGTNAGSGATTTDTEKSPGAAEDADDAAPGAAGAEQAPGPVERAAAAAVRSADREHGGWGSGPKFPQPTRIDVLFDAGTPATSDDAAEQDEYHAVARGALAAMVDGGLYDHVGGGFHRYCTDREWVVPHFEKMLYDNAEIPRVLLAGYQVSGRERYATVASETFAFLDRELARPDGVLAKEGSEATRTSSEESRESDGAFASTLDARSAVPPERTPDGDPGEDEEGAFYVWTPEEVRSALEDVDAADLLEESSSSADLGALDSTEIDTADVSADDVDPDDVDPTTFDLADLVCERYGITEAGNFEGATVLTVDVSLQDLATDRELEPATVRDLLDGARERLLVVREERPRPRRDDKVIGAWNGLAIRALAEGALVLEDESLGERAREALDAVRDRLWDGDSLARRYVLATPGEDTETATADVQGEGYLEDYAFLGRGALACYETTGAVEPLAFAIDLAEVIVDQFYDVEAGTLYVTPESGESLIARPQEPRDQSTPSSLGVGADLLAALDAFVPHDRFGDAARRVVRTHAGSLDGSPLEHPSLALAAERVRAGSTEVTVAAGSADGAGLADPWRSWLAETFLPRRLLAPRPATDEELSSWLDDLGFAETPPIWAGREGRDRPTAYVCRGFTCSRPLQDPADADAWL